MDKNDGRVVSNFINQALEGKDITIYGDGTQTRSFCYIDDLIEGIIRMMNTKDSFIGPINLGNPTEFSVKELAQIIIEETDSESRIVYEDLPEDDPTQRRPDISLAYNNLDGWLPEVSIIKGLRKTISYYKEELEKSKCINKMI
jgi:UDP-glucuronate decarboxylase